MRPWSPLILAGGVAIPGILLRIGLFDASDPVRALLFGVAIIGASFLLSWAAEVVQLDISQGLALALLAVLAILPEYVVDASYAWLAAEKPEYAEYAVANMTGANRLLIGLAWPMVILIIWFRTRRRSVELSPSHGLELVTLLAATAYAFILPFKGNISIVDFVVLGSIFGFYVWRLTKLPAEEPHLVGPAEAIGSLPDGKRRLLTAGLAIVAGGIVLLVAKRFATALVGTGTELGVDEFLLVQWLAPLASEAPEFVVVGIFAWRASGGAALGTVVSSKVNQWTLLVGMLPLIYAIALGSLDPLPLDARQEDEILLTAAQSLFAVSLLLDRRLSVIGAGILFGLFGVQFAFPDTRVELSIVYVILTIGSVFISRAHILETFKMVAQSFRKSKTAPLA
jgi:cation:H+ antiporter